MNITIDDLIYLMADASFFQIEVYNIATEKTVYVGPADDVQDKYRYEVICSLDSPTKDSLCINIDVEPEQ